MNRATTVTRCVYPVDQELVLRTEVASVTLEGLSVNLNPARS